MRHHKVGVDALVPEVGTATGALTVLQLVLSPQGVGGGLGDVNPPDGVNCKIHLRPVQCSHGKLFLK